VDHVGFKANNNPRMERIKRKVIEYLRAKANEGKK